MGSMGVYDAGKKKGEPLYEAKLMVGMNRIEIEVIAERAKTGKSGKENETKGDKEKEKELVEVEKCVIFAHLMA